MITAKTKKNKHIDELHFEHQLWTSAIKFYYDELKIYQRRLEEIAFKNTRLEARAGIEHFQNQFIVQEEQLDILNHDITEHEEWLSEYAKAHPAVINKELFADHKIMREKMEAFHNVYTDLKHEFNNFLIEWM